MALLVMGGCAVAPSFDDPGLTSDVDGGTVTNRGGGGGSSSGGATDTTGGNDASSEPDGASPAPAQDAGQDAKGAAADSAPPPSPPPPPGVQKPAAGEVLISELMYDPSGTEPDNEWIELFNTTASDKLLSGLVLHDGGGRTHVIAGAGASTVIPAGAYVVFARNKTAAVASKIPAASILYDYGAGLTATEGILLANASTGSLTLQDGATQIAQAPYGGWYNQASPGGHSVELKGKTAAGAGSAAGWCLGSKAWVTGADMATPGAANDCP